MNPWKTRFDPLPSEVYSFWQQIRNPVDAEHFHSLHAEEIALGKRALEVAAEESVRRATDANVEPSPWFYNRQLSAIEKPQEREAFIRVYGKEIEAENAANALRRTDRRQPQPIP